MCENINHMWRDESVLEELISGRRGLKVYKILEPIVDFNIYLPSSGKNIKELRWKKLKKISKELEHLASNIIIAIVKIHNCSTLVIEDLRGLNGKKFARRLNRRIYRTIRAGIFKKLTYNWKAYPLIV